MSYCNLWSAWVAWNHMEGEAHFDEPRVDLAIELCDRAYAVFSVLGVMAKKNLEHRVSPLTVG